jgi:hypothetical protein
MTKVEAKDLLDLRGDLPNPRRIEASELNKLPRVEARTTDPHDPSREIIYSGTPLEEVLKAGGLMRHSGMTSPCEALDCEPVSVIAMSFERFYVETVATNRSDFDQITSLIRDSHYRFEGSRHYPVRKGKDCWFG